VLLSLAGISCSGLDGGCVDGVDPSGCDDEAAADESQSDAVVLGTARQAVVGGSAVTSAENTVQPYVSVVRLTPSPDPKGMQACSALKVSSGSGSPPVDRFLTAAHCFDFWTGGLTQIQITNAINFSGDPGKTHQIQKIYIHPTYRLRMLVFSDPASAQLGSTYDVAFFDAFSISTPNGIPPLATINASFIPLGTAARLTGYGSGSKRKGDNSAAEIPGGDNVFWDEGAASVSHIYWPGSPVKGETGDSGSALLSALGAGGAWEIIGVLHGPFNTSGGGVGSDTMFARTGGIRQWMLNPVGTPPIAATSQGRGRLINAASAKCINMFNANPDRFATMFTCYGSPTDGVNEDQYFHLLAGSSSTRFLIRSGVSAGAGTSLCLQPSTGSPSEIQQKTCSSSNANQNWEFVPDSNDMPGIGSILETTPVYQLRNVGTGTCMEPGTTSLTRIEMKTCNDVTRNPQKWVFSR
jgi:hypothetical protein